jgi:hypothetical protein
MSHTIPLRTPLSAQGGKIEALKLCEPTAQEVWTASGQIQTSQTPEAVTLYLRALVAASSGLREEDLDDLPISVLAEAHEWLRPFLDDSLEPEQNPPTTLTLPINPPLTEKGITYDTLSLQEPTTGHIRRAQSQLRRGVGAQTLRAYQIWLVSFVAEIPYDVAKRFPISTLNRAVSYLSGFSRPGQETGGI